MKKKTLKRLISSVLAALTLASSLSIGCAAMAADLVVINETNFPDKNFMLIVSEYYDTNSNGRLDEGERSRKVITLSAYLEEIAEKYGLTDEEAVIENLKGIEYFTSLENLYCSSVGLKTLDVSKNLTLKQLTCMSNGLEKITLTQPNGDPSNLVRIKCSDNKLTSLDVSRCPNLQQLECNTNKITSINLNSNPDLALLYIHQNELGALTVSSNPKLAQLYCANNHIWELDLSANAVLVGATSDEIGNQWVNATANLRTNSTIIISHTFKNIGNIEASTLDKKVENGNGEWITVSAFTGSGFSTTEVDFFKDQLKDENHEYYDGFVYKYNVGNSTCEPMTVNVVVSREFYQVNFYVDEEKSDRIAYYMVPYGTSVTAPADPEAPQCQKFVGWSRDFSVIDDDMDICAVWKDDHDIIKYIDASSNIDIHCTKCNLRTIRFNFMNAYNASKNDANYSEVGDVNKDGVINAKDYAIIIAM